MLIKNSVLLVMPESEHTSVLAEMLGCVGYDVTTASSGADGLALHRKHDFAAVVLQQPPTDLPTRDFLDNILVKLPFQEVGIPYCIVTGEGSDEIDTAHETRFTHVPDVNNPVMILRLLSFHLNVNVKGPDVSDDVLVMDMQHLREFTDGDPDLERELADVFFENSEMCLADLESRIADPEAWRKTAHRLKGSAGNLGAQRLSKSAERAEKSDPDVELLTKMRTELSSLRSFFEIRGLV